MEGVLPPRGGEPTPVSRFQETDAGGVLEFGGVRNLVVFVVIGAVPLALGAFFLSAALALGGTESSGGWIVIMAGAGSMLLGVVLLVLAVGSRGPSVIRVDDRGIQIARGRWKPTEVPWESVHKIRHSSGVFRLGASTRAYAFLRVDARHSPQIVSVDTTRNRVNADDIDRMAAVLKGIAARRGIPVGPVGVAAPGPR